MGRMRQDDDRMRGKVCTSVRRCDDDDDEDTLYTIWNFFAGLLIGGLCICVCLQQRFIRWKKRQAAENQ